ncbi:MAG: hypothetical protein QXT28_06965 [Thermofilaceae archaeon]
MDNLRKLCLIAVATLIAVGAYATYTLSERTYMLSTVLSKIESEIDQLKSGLAAVANQTAIEIEEIRGEVSAIRGSVYGEVDNLWKATRSLEGELASARRFAEDAAARSAEASTQVAGLAERVRKLEAEQASFAFYGSWIEKSSFYTTPIQIDSKFKIAVCFLGESWSSSYIIGYVDAADPTSQVVYFTGGSGILDYTEQIVSVPKSGTYRLYVAIDKGELYMDLYLPA